jgi:ElaA protein
MSQLNWCLKKFDDLSSLQLYNIMQLRNEVFVVEQHCIYQDADNKDKSSHHLMGMTESALIAYARLIPPGLAYPESSIGRVVTASSLRRTGLGQELMQHAIQSIYQLYGRGTIRIGAQLYLTNFYDSIGFKTTGDTYLEDGIKHIEMFLPV